MQIPLHHPGLDRTIYRTPRQAKVLASSGWVPVDDDGEVAEPPRSGAGSGVKAWRKFAEAIPALSDAVDEKASRDDIIAAWDTLNG